MQKAFTVLLDEEFYKKLKEIAKNEKRAIRNQAALLIEKQLKKEKEANAN